MLTPEYLRDLPEVILALYSRAEREILADMARRIVTYDYWIPAADWQNLKLREAGRTQDEILKALHSLTGKTETELRRLMQEAGSLTLSTDAATYAKAGLQVPSIKDSEPLKKLLQAGYRATAQEFTNLCRTTARTATLQFEEALDRAWMKVQSGAFSTDQAISDAVQELSRQGLGSIRYPSGRTDSLETAVRRAVVTGVNQTCGQLQEELADEVGCDLVEVSAHGGARPEHAAWQGKIYSRSGKDTKYPSLRAVTGYGRVDGLCGVNCRHTMSVCIDGAPRVWTDEELKKLEEPKYEYGGKKLTQYEAEQVQRHNEREIRRWKREYAAMDAAGLDSSEAAARLKQAEARQRDFLDKTGMKRQYGREEKAGFGYEQARTANKAAQTDHEQWLKSIGAEKTGLKSVDKYLDAKYNNSPEYRLLTGYAKAVEKRDIFPLVGFERYQEVAVSIQRTVVGIKTSTGVQIESFATHFIDRVIGQTSTSHEGMRCGVSLDAVVDALMNPVRCGAVRELQDGDIRQTFYGKYAAVTISIRDNRLIQTNPEGG